MFKGCSLKYQGRGSIQKDPDIIYSPCHATLPTFLWLFAHNCALKPDVLTVSKSMIMKKLGDPAILPLDGHSKETQPEYRRNMESYVYCSTIHNNQGMGLILVSTNRLVDKENVAYIHTIESYSVIREDEILTFPNDIS